MFNKFKELDKPNKFIIILTIIIMILLIGNLIISIRHISQFKSVKNSGNDRWFQVEERILTYEHKVDQLEEIIKNLK